MPTALRAIVVFLVVVGVTSALGRVLLMDRLTAEVEPMRTATFARLGLTDAFAAQRAAEIPRVDRRFADARTLTLLHVVPGALYLLLAPLQFLPGLRARHPAWHRWSGRVLVALAVVLMVPAVKFGIIDPLTGGVEAAAITVFGALFLVSLGRAVVAIRRGQVAVHREWMIRAFAVGLGIATVRVVAPVVDLVLTLLGVGPLLVFALTLWAGWVPTVCVAEWWIRRTRTTPAAAAAARTGAAAA